ncbi:hypothetical protein [Xanthocytophaga agilis]|uniref:Uncharacterized protein n=1 Tax=Xanthocytophaga agilis TaxID=3048010 RepID=A0AAE3R5M1_9BACT|nr:hypothetical protein [Xanthocytophaga agilis]MDJ1501263.1 hypothetical protein [Xanthocytophaga agilis]
MYKSRSLAGIIGPTLIVMVASELKLWNPTLYDEQIIPLIYLSGVLFFIAGLTIVRAHNNWVLQWPVVITILGWLCMALGLLRMFFPQAYKGNFSNDISAMVVEIILISVGVFLSFKAYWPKAEKDTYLEK